MASSVQRLRNPVQPYAWGSRTVLAELLGRTAPSDGPEAELWIGAHPHAPSEVVGGDPLDRAIASDPKTHLGSDDARLPFLLKVLAVERPLSLQVHPDADQARRGFADEEAKGVPRGAPHRNYRDDWPKPELLCALTPFEALAGFRAPGESAALLASLGIERLGPVRAALERSEIGAAVSLLARWPEDDRDGLVAEVRKACAVREEPELQWGLRLAEAYPGDPGVVIALLLNLIVLAPGEALYVRPGMVHAYLRGAGVEIMACSDNVLRGGLTGKHVDVPELLAVTDFGAAGPALVEAEPVAGGQEVYRTPATQFELSRCRVADGRPVVIGDPGPSTLLVLEGRIELRRGPHTEILRRGEAAFVPYEGGELTLAGTGTAYRAALPR